MITKAYLFLPFFLHFLCIVGADGDFPSANVSASWKNDPSNEKGSVEFYNGATLRPILIVCNSTYPAFGMGFFRNRTSISTANSFYLVVFMIYRDFHFDSNSDEIPSSLVVLWSANRDKPVRENATLDFSAEGELVLKDADGSPVWSTDNTSGHSAARVEIAVGGNLMLLNHSNGVVWQSFDHPTDTWLPNQKIYKGQRLTARNSWSNLSTGMYYLSVTANGIHAFLDSNPPKEYANLTDVHESVEWDSGMDITYWETYAQFNFNHTPSDFRYIVIEPNGHLTLYQVEKLNNFFVVRSYADILSTATFAGDCMYPRVCGRYGICLDGGGCNCPVDHNENSNYFRQFQPDVGCEESTPLSCKDGPKSHTYLKLPNVTYFDFVPMLLNTTIEKCKEACLSNCSCKAALFRYKERVSSGDCSLQSDELYSFWTTTKEESGFNYYSFIKVQKRPHQTKPVKILVPCLLGGLVATSVAAIWYRYRMLKNTPDAEEESDDEVTEVLTKFSFEEMKSSTQNFQIKIGQGGFGSVFEGVCHDGTTVAVKCLDSVGQGRKEFLAEVNTIGKVDHFSLVRLIGYCAERSNRILVYEYMCNGSLDRWIFNIDKAKTLSWRIRQKIIYGVAKGLEYLHEECHKKIIHFDIKPQNILLDGDFNAKISDFGLAKMIDRNQNLVLTALKGTPGYLAPELFGGSNVSVKADVYSFGVVILETVCGRKNLVSSLDDTPLINIVKTKAEEDQLCDLIDESNEAIQCHKEEATKMIKIGIWCLQTHDKRPSMSTVVKALEGLTDIDLITDHHFLTMSHTGKSTEFHLNISAAPEVSFLSGPR